MTQAVFEAVARRDRIVVYLALIFVVGASIWLLQTANDALMRFDAFEPTGMAYLLLLFVMWWMMMLAMMLPSAAPAILLHAAMARRSATAGSAQLRSAVFVSGYMAIWTGFSLAATALHAAIASLHTMTPMMATTSRMAGAALLIGAGIYQLTAFKAACLKHCQSPIMFFSRHWKPGTLGAFRLGSRHGLYCLGCCAVLMAVLFYGGVMEPLWIGGLAFYVLIEKILPPSWPLRRFSGVLLIGWGLLVFFGHL